MTTVQTTAVQPIAKPSEAITTISVRPSPTPLVLNNKNRQEWLQDILSSPTPDSTEKLIQVGRELAAEHLPEEIKEQIARINQLGGLTYCYLKGLPIDPQLPPTPKDGKRLVSKQTRVSEIVLLGVIAYALNAEPFAYLEEKGGELIQEVVPIEGLENTNSNAGVIDFGLHSDNAILQPSFRPEGIALFSLRNKGAKTIYAPVDEAIGKMESIDVEVLRQPRFRVRTPESFNLYGGKIITSEPRPIITDGLAGLEIALATYNVQLANKRDKDAELALLGLRLALRPPVVKSFVLEPGDLLVISNIRGLHGRGQIAGDRWLQRTYFRQDLNDLRRFTNSSETCRVFSSANLVLL